MSNPKRLLQGALGVVALVVFGLFLTSIIRRLSAPAPVAGSLSTEPNPYPPPAETTLPTWTPESTVGYVEGPSGDLIPPSPTQWPTFTPYPTPTLGPEPTATPIPLTGPADSAAGKIWYVARAGGDGLALVSLNVDASGRALQPASQIALTQGLPFLGHFYPSPGSDRVVTFDPHHGESFIIDASTGAVEPTFEGHPAPLGRFYQWHPDGQHILMRADDYVPDIGLWLVDTRTWEHTPLAIPGTGRVVGGAISPEGLEVIYSVRKGLDDRRELWRVDVYGRHAQRLLQLNGQALNLSWSPDGTRLAFLGEGLTVMDVEDLSLHTFDDPRVVPTLYPPVWSPDSKHLAVMTAPGELPLSDPWNPGVFEGANIYLVDVETGDVRPLLADESGGNLYPAWSPDGSQIVFVSDRSGASELWAVNADGGNLRQLTADGLDVRFTIWVTP